MANLDDTDDKAQLLEKEHQSRQAQYAIQDNKIGQIGEQIAIANQIAHEMDDVLSTQNQTLKYVEVRVDEQNGRLKHGIAKIRHLLQHGKDRCKLCTICGLIMILLVLLIFLI